MFFSRYSLDVIVKTKDEALVIIVAAKQSEINSAHDEIDRLREELEYERHRADALVDRLLVRDARVAAVAPAALAAAAQMDKETLARAKAVADVMNEPAGAIPSEFNPAAGPRAFEFAGRGRGVVS